MVAQEFIDVEGQQFPPDGFVPNETLVDALIDAARRELRWWQWRKKRAVVRALSQMDYRYILEAELTDMAFRAGALPPEASFETVGGLRIYGGPWTDLFDWIIQNWPAIMEMILSIISLFASREE